MLLAATAQRSFKTDTLQSTARKQSSSLSKKSPHRLKQRDKTREHCKKWALVSSHHSNTLPRHHSPNRLTPLMEGAVGSLQQPGGLPATWTQDGPAFIVTAAISAQRCSVRRTAWKPTSTPIRHTVRTSATTAPRCSPTCGCWSCTPGGTTSVHTSTNVACACSPSRLRGR